MKGMILLVNASPFQSKVSTWKLIDHSKKFLQTSALHSFAYDDLLCTLAGKKDQPSLRFWVHQNTIVLGTQDSRLDYINEAITFLKKNNYHVVVRNSGGLAVLLDDGVLNLSLIFPGETTSSIDAGYERMVALIRALFPQATIQTGEVVGSYCPGSYDLSIDGKKFAGISQRRIRGGIAVQIYLCVTGSGAQRAHMVKQMYEHGIGQSKPSYTVPSIDPAVMGSLNELLNTTYTVEEIVQRTIDTASTFGISLEPHMLSEEEDLLFEAQLERVTQRQHRCLQ
ncbi:lipoate--protein ligase family protein [Shouchella lehensis]|nr:lipoate--protein ligase family protein [Shouchella lehensis]